MNTDNEATQMEIHAPPPPPTPAPAPQKSKIPTAAWIVGCGCLFLLCASVMIALVVAGYFYFFSGRDPISAVVPGSSLVYVNIDLLQTQTDQFNKIVPIFQGITGAEKKPLADSLEESLQNELGLSFKSEVMPWIGQHSGFAITGGDIQSQDFEFMFIMEARDKTLADAFITKYVAAMDAKNGKKFAQKDVNGVTFYVYNSGSGRKNDLVVARSGSFVYLANAEAPVISSINLKSADSLASSSQYKQALSTLPSSRIASFYINGEALAKYSSSLSSQLVAPPAAQSANGLSGVGMALSLQDEGLRFDIAIAYDESKLNDFQKESLKAKYMAPQTDKLLPENTFFFLGVNSSQSPAQNFQDNNPLYTQDMQEALDLLEKQYNVSLKDLLAMLTGEFSVALGPSNDGILASQGHINLGITMFAGTNNEAGFNAWADKAKVTFTRDAASQLNTTDVAIGDYKLHQVSTEGPSSGGLLLYGAGKGYIIVGTSQDILKQGLSGSGTLADNVTYKNTWKAFPSKSVPYIYANMSGILDFYKSLSSGSLGSAEEDLRKIPVIAATMNQNSGYVNGITLIVFINTK